MIRISTLSRSCAAVATLALSLALAGCSGGAADDDDDGGTPINDATAQKAGGSLASSAEFGATAYRVRAGNNFAPCPIVTSAGDTDSDGVPDFAGYEYAGCNMMTPWGASVVTGDSAITDNQPAVAGYDFSLAEDLQIEATGVSVSYEVVQVASFTGGNYQLEEPSVIVETYADHTHTQELAVTKSYTPASAWQPGDAIVAGSYEFGGAWEITLQDALGTSVLQAVVSTSSPLQLDPACPTLVVGGSLDAVLNGANGGQILQITWTGCDASGTELVVAP